AIQRCEVPGGAGGRRICYLFALLRAEGERSAMKSLAVAAACALAVAGFALAAPGALAAAKNVCPPGGASHTTFNGGLLVTGNNYCLLDHVTVNGGVTVVSGSDVDLENSPGARGVNLTPGPDLELSFTLSHPGY